MRAASTYSLPATVRVADRVTRANMGTVRNPTNRAMSHTLRPT